jgi:hypothetical protein
VFLLRLLHEEKGSECISRIICSEVRIKEAIGSMWLGEQLLRDSRLNFTPRRPGVENRRRSAVKIFAVLAFYCGNFFRTNFAVRRFTQGLSAFEQSPLAWLLAQKPWIVPHAWHDETELLAGKCWSGGRSTFIENLVNSKARPTASKSAVFLADVPNPQGIAARPD